MTAPAILLSRADVAALLTPADHLAAVEAAFAASREGRAPSPPPLHLAVTGGGFHAKGAALLGALGVAAVKLNGNFPGNPARGLPTIQGVILLCDAANGAVLAAMDSIEITLRRTAAATALAARHLARSDSAVLAVCGCGAQARPQVEALAPLFPLARAYAWDRDPARAGQFATEMTTALGISCAAVGDLAEATAAADIIVTCTTARSPFLGIDDVARGAFVAAVGADNPEKSEIAPGLMARARVVCDSLDQCLAMGDLRHAVAAGAMTASDVHGELADLVTGARPGRSAPDQVFVFDSTGTAIQDVASAALAWERARARGIGTPFAFGW
ncbi:MAG: ornithine cyclodeaminase family protein [Alphaproteobacteria bacterium]